MQINFKSRFTGHFLQKLQKREIAILKYFFPNTVELKMGLVKMRTEGYVSFQNITP